MKNILTFILIFVSLIVNAQSSLDKRFILVAEWDGNTILNDSMWRMNVLFAEDQLNGGYLPTQIQVGHLALDATGRRYRIKNIVDATFSTAILDVVEEEDLNMPPIGVGIVYVKNLTDIIHSVVHSNTQISPSLMSKIFIHNMVKIDEVALVSSDYTRLLQDSIVVYYANNAEIGRDTVRLNIVSDLENLADVDITGVADKSILYYDLASQKWRDTTSNVYVSGSGTTNRIPIYNGNTSITSNSNLTFDGTTFNANSAAVFNDAGAAVDFRVESDNDANKLFVSGSTDRVGIGINSPTNTLDIDGTLRIRNLNSVTSTGLLGVDANGVAERITIGTGLNLTNDVLTATGTLSGSGTSNRVAFWSGTTSLSGNDSLFYDSANGRLGIGGITNPRVGLEVNADQIVVASNVWTSGNLSSETAWNKIHYADGKFVVVGNDNRVAVSYDGKIWNYYAVPDSNNWVGLTYGEGLWVAIASAGSTRRIMTSNDAINWTPLNYNISNVRGVIYGDKLFVIYASGQTFFKSSDGVNWSSFTVPFSAIWNSGIYVNGVYMFVNDNTSSMVVSTDGNTWSTKVNSGRGLSISYGNGMYISVGTNRRIRYSYDFDTWTEYTYTPLIENLVDIQYNDGIFLTLSSTGVIITSVDGLNWVQKTSGVTESFLSAAYGNGIWNCLVSTGIIRNITSGKVSSYYNGKNNNYFGKHSFLGEISFNELVADQIVYRTNIWTQGTLSSSTIWNDVHYADGKFVAVGNDNQVALSNDGRTWNYYAVPDSNNWVKVTYGQGLWVAVANAGSTRRIMTSNDGITWNPITFNSAIINIIYGNGAFIAIRSGLTSSISFDGITWQNITLPVSVSWATGLYINGTYYIFSSFGTTAALSIDGINWTSFTAISSSSLAYGDGVIVSINGTNVRYSYDLITWQTPLLPISATWNNIKYNDGIFVAISTNGSIITSKDGINWFLKQSNVTNNLTGITYGNGLWMIVSNNGDNRNITSGKYESILYPIGDVFYNNFRITRSVSIGTSNQPAYSLDIPTTNAIRIPSGTTLQRPVGATGVLRYNTSDNRLEFHNGTTWENPINGSGTTNELTFFSGSTTLTSSPRIKFETDGGLVLKNTAEPVSSTFVATQDFTTNTDWTTGTGWSITGGLATATAATGALTYTPTVTITNGRAYLVTVTQSGYSAGTVTIALGNATSALPQYNVTNWAVLLRPTASTGGFRFTTSTYTGSLDNVSILEITPGTVLQAFETSASGTNNMPIVAPNSSTLAIGGGGIYNTTTNNTFIGINSGLNNISGNSNMFIGLATGRNNTTGSSNVFLGANAGLSNTIGGSNVFIGTSAGQNNTTGTSNSFIGINSGLSNTTANNNIFIGTSSGSSNTTGANNVFIGTNSGSSNISSGNNTFLGVNSGLNINLGGSNTFIGLNSGRYIFSGVSLTNISNSVMIGDDTRALADNSSNEIVIGSGGRGNGNNTVTIGNSSITAHYLSGTGAVQIPTGTTAQRPSGIQGMLRYNSTNNNTEFHTGTAWEYPLKSATENGLGTAGRLFYADINGRAKDTSTMFFNNGILNVYSGSYFQPFNQRTLYNCQSPAGGFISNINPILQIKLPAPAFGGGQNSANTVVKFDLDLIHSTSPQNNSKFQITIQGTGAPNVIFANAISLGYSDPTTLTFSFGHDGQNIIVWLSGAVNYSAVVSNVVGSAPSNNSTSYNEDLSFFCNNWQLSSVSSIIGTQQIISAPVSAYNQLVKFDGFYLSPGSGATSSGLVATQYINGAGAYEITIKKSPLMTSTAFEFSLEMSLLGVSSTILHKGVVISGIINFSTLTWTDAKVIFPYGNPTNTRLNFRFGNDGTDIKIWIGELNTPSGILSGVQITNVTSYSPSTNYDPNVLPTFLEFIKRSTWSISLQASTFSTVNITRFVNTVNQIPYKDNLSHNYSNNFTYNPTTNRLAIGGTGSDRTLHVTGEARITDLTTDTPTRIVGADADGDLGAITTGNGLTLTSGTLDISGFRGVTTLTTDASGDITLSITMPDATYSAVAIPEGQTFYVVTAHTKTTSSVKFRIYDSTGNIVPSGTSISINYNITDY